MNKGILAFILAVCVTFLWVFSAGAVPYEKSKMGAATELANSPDYNWWYGCSPTSVGMMMGYYDRNGYAGLSYDNLVPGGVAESSNYGNSNALANSIIASAGHIADFYVGNFGDSGDDVAPPFHDFNSLADFMGTSQDSLGSTNGSTWLYNHNNGSRLYASDAVAYGIQDSSGMYGILEYLEYAGYGAAEIYNQYTDNLGLDYGFTFGDYRNEIDAGRVVMIHVESHSMFGYGYDATTNEVLLHDTWTEGEHTMTWGGAYSDLNQFGVTCFTPSGGTIPSIPEPGTFFLIGTGLMGMACFYRRRRTK